MKSLFHRKAHLGLKALLFLFTLSVSATLLRAEKIPGLGTDSFPTSTHSAAAQREFIRGLLLLHVFEYPSAVKAFLSAEKLDPGFAMAYWGEAMTFNHPVWNELDVPAGQAALAKFGATPQARAARIANPRERAYMNAVAILYSGQGTKRERDAQYTAAMQQLSQAYPSDDDAQLFYALALLGQSEGVRDVPVYLKAAAIARAVFLRNPESPGAAHYWIHGMDDPQHAAGALVAARALSKIAPDAGHAQHMCSHIFMALGMWNDVVTANEQAMRVVDDQDRAAGRPVVDCGHYDIWLEYGYFQQGRPLAANRILTECRRTGDAYVAWARTQPGNTGRAASRAASISYSLITMRGIALIESEDWDGHADRMHIDETGLDPDAVARNTFDTGYAAAERGDPALAATSLVSLRASAAQIDKSPNGDPEDVSGVAILEDDLSGLIASQFGDKDGSKDHAIALVEKAAAAYGAMAFAFGPPVTVKPPNELLGELLLQQKKYPQAKVAFQTALLRAPRRTEALLGLAHAERGMGDHAAASATDNELLQIWKSAEPGYAPKQEALSDLAALHQQ